MNEESPLLERHLIEMMTIAGEYCITLEKAEQTTREELIRFFTKVVPILYLKGLLFPVTDEPEEPGNERFVTEEQWENVFNSIRNVLAQEDEFVYLSAPGPEDQEISIGSLAEIFADVYQDMKDFIWLMTKNTALAREYAAFNLKTSFLEIWGSKLLTAQQVLHSRYLSHHNSSDKFDLDFE